MNLTKLSLAIGGLAIASSAFANVTLEGDYVKTTITDSGVMNSLIYDPTGTGNFIANTDYVAPGIPFEGFGVRIGTGSNVFNSNSGGQNIPSVGALTSSSIINNGGSVTWAGSYGGLFDISHVFSFSNTEQRVNITTTFHALQGLADVRISRAVDPDPDNYPGGTADTDNQRGIVSPAVAKTDFVGSVGQISGRPLGLYYAGDIEHNTGIVGSCCSVTDPDRYLVGGDQGDSSSDDHGIGLGFRLGDLAADQTIAWSYAYVMGGSLGTIDIPDPTGDVPEPFSLALVGLGLAGIGLSRRRKASKQA